MSIEDADDARDPEAISVTARWLILTTDVSRDFARALLPEPFEVPDRPELAAWIVEPLSDDSVGIPAGRLLAGMSCSCLLPGEQDESAFTSDFLTGTPMGDEDRAPFALPPLPQTTMSLVNDVGGMGFSVSPVDGEGRGMVGRVELSECGSTQAQLAPDWLVCQSWRTDRVVDASDADRRPGLVHTQWELTRLSPIVTGPAVVECAEFGSRNYDLSDSAAELEARYGFARLTIVGRQQP
ncbi:acetoacetate decarboxylase family protein [Rhodococcus spongiicola]|uniref:acetoacetate decarboxylase family protein n=1 Tax=Rhodococcus spongiicola TaxID=2487352 RepID=UPI001F37D649|nr:acetoacetate decarboxylase family protein [Rhodococcus spongiicola]